MNVENKTRSSDQEKNILLDAFADEINKSKADLISDIEARLSELLGMNAKEAFHSIAAAQQIRGGTMNLNRAHKSALVLLAYVLANKDNSSERKE
jgi:hypothetical protein